MQKFKAPLGGFGGAIFAVNGFSTQKLR